MPTDRDLEQKLIATYPRSLANLQQLIMDSEACADSHSEGGEIFELAFDKFMETLGYCVHCLVSDEQTADSNDAPEAIKALNLAMWRCELTYGGNWPTAFQFWKDWYAQFSNKLKRQEEQ